MGGRDVRLVDLGGVDPRGRQQRAEADRRAVVAARHECARADALGDRVGGVQVQRLLVAPVGGVVPLQAQRARVRVRGLGDVRGRLRRRPGAQQHHEPLGLPARGGELRAQPVRRGLVLHHHAPVLQLRLQAVGQRDQLGGLQTGVRTLHAHEVRVPPVRRQRRPQHGAVRPRLHRIDDQRLAGVLPGDRCVSPRRRPRRPRAGSRSGPPRS
jgi:hypothetical protein